MGRTGRRRNQFMSYSCCRWLQIPISKMVPPPPTPRAGRELKLTPAGADCIPQRRNFFLCCTGRFCSLSALMLAAALVIFLSLFTFFLLAHLRGSTNAIHPSLHTQMKTGQVPWNNPLQGHQTNQQHKTKTCKSVVLNLLRLWPFHTGSCVVVTPKHKFALVLQHCSFSTFMNGKYLCFLMV